MWYSGKSFIQKRKGMYTFITFSCTFIYNLNMCLFFLVLAEWRERKTQCFLPVLFV